MIHPTWYQCKAEERWMIVLAPSSNLILSSRHSYLFNYHKAKYFFVDFLVDLCKQQGSHTWRCQRGSWSILILQLIWNYSTGVGPIIICLVILMLIWEEIWMIEGQHLVICSFVQVQVYLDAVKSKTQFSFNNSGGI